MKNVKRIICFFLVFCFVFSLSSCNNSNNNNDDNDDNETTTSDYSKPEMDLEGYKDIKCKTSEGTDFRYFLFDDNDTSVLSVAFPIEWTIQESDVGCDIFRDNEKIGTFKPGKTSLLPDETVCKSETNASGGAKFEWNIILREGTYIHRIIYGCKIGQNDYSMTLEVGYDEFDEFSLKRAKFSISVKKIKTEPGIGTIDLSARPGEKPILIVGNSFVGSSRVGAIFEHMCQASSKNNYEVVWVSQGMATVSNNWSEYKSDMRAGKYAAVFMCGFYGSDDVAAFKNFVDLCKSSNTPIVIFPAHNEAIDANIVNSYPDAHYLDWKGELNALISSGVDRWDLCIDDYYDHSLPLAGYVGAHMIYRALFGEMPPILNQYDDVSYSTVIQKLGDYAQTGCVSMINDDMIIYKMN